MSMQNPVHECLWEVLFITAKLWKQFRCPTKVASYNHDPKIFASSPIPSWQIDGEIMETVRDYFFGLRNHCDGDCSHEIKRCLLLGRRTMANLNSTLKSRDITLPTKVCLVKAMVLSVVLYACESWTIKKAEC